MNYQTKWEVRSIEQSFDENQLAFQFFQFNPSTHERVFNHSASRRLPQIKLPNKSEEGLNRGRSRSINGSEQKIIKISKTDRYMSKEDEEFFESIKKNQFQQQQFFASQAKEKVDVDAMKEQIQLDKLKDKKLAQQARSKLQQALDSKPALFTKQFYTNFKKDTKYFDSAKIQFAKGESPFEKLNASLISKSEVRGRRKGILGLIGAALENKNRVSHKFKLAQSIELKQGSPHKVIERLTPDLQKEVITVQSHRDLELQEAELMETYYKRRDRIKQKLKIKSPRRQ